MQSEATARNSNEVYFDNTSSEYRSWQRSYAPRGSAEFLAQPESRPTRQVSLAVASEQVVADCSQRTCASEQANYTTGTGAWKFFGRCRGNFRFNNRLSVNCDLLGADVANSCAALVGVNNYAYCVGSSCRLVELVNRA